MTQEQFVNILREHKNLINPTLYTLLEEDAGIFTDVIRDQIATKIQTAAQRMSDFYTAQFLNEESLTQSLESLKKVSADMKTSYANLLQADSQSESKSASKVADSLIANL